MRKESDTTNDILLLSCGAFFFSQLCLSRAQTSISHTYNKKLVIKACNILVPHNIYSSFWISLLCSGPLNQYTWAHRTKRSEPHMSGKDQQSKTRWNTVLQWLKTARNTRETTRDHWRKKTKPSYHSDDESLFHWSYQLKKISLQGSLA